MFYNAQIPYCTNQQIDQNKYEVFYKQLVKTETADLTGKISDVFKSFQIDPAKITFAIFL